MSKSYTNKDNEVITLSKGHLDRAVEMYDELAKLSPSRRVSWAKLSKMMESEGFGGSESSENYRQAIKNARRARGTLPTVESYADMLSDEKKDAIKREIGEISFSKQDAQDTFNRLNRLKREYSRDILMVEMIQDELSKVDWSHLREGIDVFYDETEQGNTAIANLTDIHYGYLRAHETDAREVVWSVLEQYLQKLIKFGNRNAVSHFIMANLGDEIEGKLRDSSLLDARELAVEQTIVVTELITKFLVELSKYFSVSYISIAGNHSRINPNKGQAMDREDYTVIHKAIMKNNCAELGINYIDSTEHYYHILEVESKLIYLAHGDRDAIKSDKLLAELSILHEVPLDITMFGHIHHHRCTEVSEGRYQIVTGSLKGSDDFSAKINKSAGRSQAIILFEDDDFEVRQIKLD